MTSGFLDDIHIIMTLYCVFQGGEIDGGTHPWDITSIWKDFWLFRWCTHYSDPLLSRWRNRWRNTSPRPFGITNIWRTMISVFLNVVHIIITLYYVFQGGEIGGGTHPRDPVAVQASEGLWFLVVSMMYTWLKLFILYFKVEKSAEEHIPESLWQYKHLKDCDFWFLQSRESMFT